MAQISYFFEKEAKMPLTQKLKKIHLTQQIVIAFVLAIVAGCLLQGYSEFVNAFIKPFGIIFLNLLKFIVAPLVLLSIVVGIISTKNLSSLGKIGFYTLVYFMFTTVLATVLGLLIPTVLKGCLPLIKIPETNITTPVSQKFSLVEQIIDFFPNNPIAPFYSAIMIQVIVIAVVFGVAIVHVGANAEPVRNLVLSLNEVVQKILKYIMCLAPIGVFCMLTPVVVNNGPYVLGSLAAVIAMAYGCFLIHALVVYLPCICLLGRYSPLEFLKRMQPALIFAFSSDSSVATLPYSIKSTEKMGVKRDIGSFVLSLGATINMDGVAIYLCVSAVFMAACCGIVLTPGMYLSIAFMATVASIGTPGIPGASLTFMAMLFAYVGIPVECVAVVAGIDRIIDMGRTVMSVVGDASCAVIVQRLVSRKAKNT